MAKGKTLTGAAAKPSAPAEADPKLEKKKETNLVRLNVEISRDLHKRLKMRALEEDKFVRDIVRTLIEDYLK